MFIITFRSFTKTLLRRELHNPPFYAWVGGCFSDKPAYDVYIGTNVYLTVKSIRIFVWSGEFLGNRYCCDLTARAPSLAFASQESHLNSLRPSETLHNQSLKTMQLPNTCALVAAPTKRQSTQVISTALHIKKKGRHN
jgi:hypothetical protein